MENTFQLWMHRMLYCNKHTIYLAVSLRLSIAFVAFSFDLGVR